jgi:predicted phage gp36 major capsid-like protein
VAARSVIIEQQRVALEQIRGTIRKHDPQALDELLSRLPGDGVPNSARQLDETVTFLAKAVAVRRRRRPTRTRPHNHTFRTGPACHGPARTS